VPAVFIFSKKTSTFPNSMGTIKANDIKLLTEIIGFYFYVVLDFESVGRGFETLRARQKNKWVTDLGLWPIFFFYNLFQT
jgi:hypothetical protein